MRLALVTSIGLLLLTGCTGDAVPEPPPPVLEATPEPTATVGVDCLPVGERIVDAIEASGQSARVVKVFALSRSTGDWYAVAAETTPGGNRGPWITNEDEFYLYRFPSTIEGWSAEELAIGQAAADRAAACLGG
jgi:hypothetical protein